MTALIKKASALLLLVCSLQASAQGRLRLLDTAIVAEPDSLPLASVSRLAVGGRSYFISDLGQRRVFEIDRRTMTTRSLGRQGSGPNEIRAPGMLELSGDTLLSVMDNGQQRLLNWDLRTRTVVSTYAMPNWLARTVFHSGKQYFAAVTMESPGIVTSISTLGPTNGGTGRAPKILRESPPLISAFGTPLIAFDSAWVYGVFETDENLYRWKEGNRAGEIRQIPKVRRKGVRASLFADLLRDPAQAATIAYDRSLTTILARMRSATLGFVTLDGHLATNRFVGAHSLTVIDLNANRACADIPVPGERDPIPVIALTGDTVIVLQQMVGADGRGSTQIRRYLVETVRCRWMPLGPWRPAP